MPELNQRRPCESSEGVLLVLQIDAFWRIPQREALCCRMLLSRAVKYFNPERRASTGAQSSSVQAWINRRFINHQVASLENFADRFGGLEQGIRVWLFRHINGGWNCDDVNRSLV
jgi:hypothetical protein